MKRPAKWPHEVSMFRTLLCLIFHRQEQHTDGMHRYRVVCECGREWVTTE